MITHMHCISRRTFLKAAAAVPLAATLGATSNPKPQHHYITNFYQFSNDAVEALATLPSGPNFLHIFAQSGPSLNSRAGRAKLVHDVGPSFKYAYCLDAGHFKGWQQATDKQLKDWAIEFRNAALDTTTPADLFAFNEMPTTGPEKPELRKRVAAWIRYAHDPGNGPKLPGVFYFTEKNLAPDKWQEDDDFWKAIDQTCILVVGEHYHSDKFVYSKSSDDYAKMIDRTPKWLEQSGKPARVSIAKEKYCALHSSYYGTAEDSTGWAGINSSEVPPADLPKYFERLIQVTRASQYGKDRIAFGPLLTADYDKRVLPILAAALKKDALAWKPT